MTINSQLTSVSVLIAYTLNKYFLSYPITIIHVLGNKSQIFEFCYQYQMNIQEHLIVIYSLYSRQQGQKLTMCIWFGFKSFLSLQKTSFTKVPNGLSWLQTDKLSL